MKYELIVQLLSELRPYVTVDTTLTYTYDPDIMLTNINVENFPEQYFKDKYGIYLCKGSDGEYDLFLA